MLKFRLCLRGVPQLLQQLTVFWSWSVLCNRQRNIYPVRVAHPSAWKVISLLALSWRASSFLWQPLRLRAWSVWKLARFLLLLLTVFLWDLLLQKVGDPCSEFRSHPLKQDIALEKKKLGQADGVKLGSSFLGAQQKANLQLVCAPLCQNKKNTPQKESVFGFFSPWKMRNGKMVVLGISCVWALFGTSGMTEGASYFSQFLQVRYSLAPSTRSPKQKSALKIQPFTSGLKFQWWVIFPFISVDQITDIVQGGTFSPQQCKSSRLLSLWQEQTTLFTILEGWACSQNERDEDANLIQGNQAWCFR